MEHSLIPAGLVALGLAPAASPSAGFEIPPRDRAPGVNEGSQLNEAVRAVSTIHYFLE